MAELVVRPVEEFEYDTWDAFVSACSAGSIYHTSTWKRLIDSSYGDGEYVLMAAFGSEGILGGFCALARNRLGVRTAVTPLLTPYTGFLIPTPGDKMAGPDGVVDLSAQSAEVLLALSQFARVYRYQSLQCGPRLPVLSGLAEAGYQITPRATLEVNLMLPEEELWQGLRGHVRRNIKKAQRANFEISDNWDVQQGYRLLSQTFAKRGERCPVAESFFTEMTAGAVLNDRRRRFCAWTGDRLRGYIVAVEDDRTVYYQLAAADGEALTAGVSSLLVWELIRAYGPSQIERFDFVGANTPSIARFKEGFGATVVPYVQADVCRSRRILVSRGLRSLFTRR